MKTTLTLTTLLSALLLVPQLTFAHAHLLKQQPAANSQIDVAPLQIELFFSEPIEPALSQITVTNADKTIVSAKKILVDSKNDKHVSVPLQTALTKGQYQVDWRVIAKDGHKTNGQYQFSVK